MSALLRLCLRIAAIEIIRSDPILLEATGGRIFDSEMGATDGIDPLPCIIVHTENSGGPAWSENNGGPPFDTTIEVAFEITCAARVEQEGQIGLFIPATTRELEAAIDLIEWRIPEALAFAETPLATATRKLVLKRIAAGHSDRFASDDTGLRLASRLLTLKCEVHEEESRVWHPDDQLPTGPFAALPDPLRTIAALFPGGSSAKETMLMVAAKLSAPQHGTEFTGADFTVSATPG